MSVRRPVYRKQALEKLAFPEQFDQLVQLTTIRSWMILAALMSVALMAILWGFFGKLTQTVEQHGVFVAGQANGATTLEVVLYIPKSSAKMLASGMAVRVTSDNLRSDGTDLWQGHVREIASQPATHDQLLATLGTADTADSFQSSEPIYETRIALDNVPAADPSRGLVSGASCSVTITIKEDRPISRVFPQPDLQ